MANEDQHGVDPDGGKSLVGANPVFARWDGSTNEGQHGVDPYGGGEGVNDDRRRKPTRLRAYDYRTPALYHVVTCTQHRVYRFGEIEGSIMSTNDVGEMVADVWNGIPVQFSDVALDAFVIMPNHIHGVIWIDPDVTETAPALGAVLKWFKSVTTSRYSAGVRQGRWPPYDGRLWQRNYYDHIVRDNRDLDRIRLYIEHNPATWQDDDLHEPHP